VDSVAVHEEEQRVAVAKYCMEIEIDRELSLAREIDTL
jgi:hypothetical protein